MIYIMFKISQGADLKKKLKIECRILLTLWFCITRQLVLSFLMRSGSNL